MGYYDNAYRLKLRTPEEAVQIVKSGDRSAAMSSTTSRSGAT